MLKSFHAALLLLGFAAFFAESSASDWPQFLGPNRNGTSIETNLLSRWPTNGLPTAWERKIGTGYGAPSVREKQLVFHHRVGEEEIVESLNAANGQAHWRYAYPSAFRDPYGYNNGPRATPLLTNNRCYTLGAEGKLICLELQTGKLIWQRDTARDWEIPEAFFGVGTSPVLENGVLLVIVGGQPNSGVVGLDPNTGKTLWESVGKQNWQGLPMTGWPGERKVDWKNYEKQAGYATPVIASIHGTPTAFCLMRQGLVSLDPRTGKVNFSLWFRAQVEDSVNAANPVVVDNMVFISAAYYRVGSVLLKIRPDGRGFDELWRSTALEMHWSTPIYHEGYLYGFSGRNEPDAHFRCVEFKTGKLMWDRDERWRGHSTSTPAVYGRGSAIMADGKLIVMGEGGLLGMFELNSREPKELARFQVPQLHYPCWAAPVLANGNLYLRSEDHLVCLRIAKKAER